MRQHLTVISEVLRRALNTVGEGAEVACSGRPCQVRATATGRTISDEWLVYVDQLQVEFISEIVRVDTCMQGRPAGSQFTMASRLSYDAFSMAVSAQ